MALTTNIGIDNFDTHVRQTSSSKTVDANLLASTTGSIFTIKLVNGTGTSFFRMYDNYDPTFGTTAPDVLIPVAGDTTMIVQCRQGIVFGTACSVASSDADGTGDAGDGNPTSLAYTLFGGL